MSGHEPVLLEQTLAALLGTSSESPRVWFDGTFGRGGHTRALLAELPDEDRLIVVDRDPEAVCEGARLAQEDERVTVMHGEWQDVLSQLGDLCFAGAMLDLGVSSPQLDTADRGFSFAASGPLDMRMDTSQGMTAAEWLNTAEEKAIADVLWRYGEERHARRIARSIVASRPLETTQDLSEAVARGAPARGKPGKHVATRTFQAVRIHVNDELGGLETMLPAIFARLAPGGRLAVITFHSLEDRLVKRFFKARSEAERLPRRLPVRAQAAPAPARLVGRSVTPRDAEVSANPRARSARLRVLERLS